MTSFDSTSWSMVLGAAAAVPEAQERFCRRYEPVVRSYLAARWRLSVEHERVADASQEVFLRCLQPGGALERVDPDRGPGFRPFLRGLVSNVASEMERRARRRPAEQGATELSLDDLVKSGLTVSRAFDRAWAEMVTAEAWEVVAENILHKRSGKLRLAVLQMRYAEGVRPREIRARLDLPDVNDVYRIMATGRYQFRIALLHVMTRYYPDLAPAALEEKCKHLVELL